MREAGGRYQGMSGGKWRTGHQAGGTRTRQEEEKEGGQMTGGGGAVKVGGELLLPSCHI